MRNREGFTPLEPFPGLLSGRVLTVTYYILIGTRPFALPRSYAPLWTIGPSDRGVARDLERCEHDYPRWAVHHIHIKVYCDYSFVLVPPAYSPECVGKASGSAQNSRQKHTAATRDAATK